MLPRRGTLRALLCRVTRIEAGTPAGRCDGIRRGSASPPVTVATD
ncbi:hypothetical protein ACFWA5_44125 [Streptomyces mirabilis]